MHTFITYKKQKIYPHGVKRHQTAAKYYKVLSYYNLQPDKNDRLRSPFHDDKTPSFQIYPKTNTYCCFSSICNAGTGDAIQFIELYESRIAGTGCSKHEALVKAAELSVGSMAQTSAPASMFIEADLLAKEAVLSKVFTIFKNSLPRNPKAIKYLQSRGLEYKQHEIGFINAGYRHELGKELSGSLAKDGLLKSKPSGGFTTWVKECIVFPLKNQH